MSNQNQQQKRAGRIRHSLRANASRNDRLRLNCFKSNDHIYAQVIDDTKGITVASCSTVDKKLAKSLGKSHSLEAATKVGEELAKRASSAGVKDVYFDRSGFRYAGRVKALADAARAGGLNF